MTKLEYLEQELLRSDVNLIHSALIQLREAFIIKCFLQSVQSGCNQHEHIYQPSYLTALLMVYTEKVLVRSLITHSFQNETKILST